MDLYGESKGAIIPTSIPRTSLAELKFPVLIKPYSENKYYTTHFNGKILLQVKIILKFFWNYYFCRIVYTTW